MRANFDEIAGKDSKRREELYPLLASLIRAEVTHRQSRSINYRISGARFPVLKDIDAFRYEDMPVDEAQFRELATGDLIEAKRNLIPIGGTGTGKTHHATAVIRARARSLRRSRQSSSSRGSPPARAAASRKPCCATTPSTSWAGFPSASQERSCCST